MRTHIIERAFELARSGDHTVKSLEPTLSREGYTGLELAHLRASPSLRADLARICKRSADRD